MIVFHAFLVWRNGGLVYEKYFHDADSPTEFDIKSVTKSVVSALAGIAQAKGLLPDLNMPVVKLFPEFARPRNTLSTVWFLDEKPGRILSEAHSLYMICSPWNMVGNGVILEQQ